MECPVRYLESFDSIRAGWQPGPNLAAEEARAQACIETMVSLAFGYDIVVQQSFALDSLAFQQVLRDLSTAYKSVTSDKSGQDFWKAQRLPVRLHLHKQSSFREAASRTFENIGKGDFYTHLYPELNGQEEAGHIAKDVSEGRISRFMERFDGDVRAELFESTWTWLGAAQADNERKVVTPNPFAHVDMDSLWEPMLSDDSGLFRGRAGEEVREDPQLWKLISAIRALHSRAADAHPFQFRSRLYSNGPWSRKGGPSAAEIVGDQLPLVQEIANTLYNQTTVSSIGSISALYSTPVSAPSLAADRMLAQMLALDSAASAKGASARPRTSPGNYESMPSLPPMRIGVKGAEGVRGKFNEYLGPASGHAIAAFEGLLELRREPKWINSLQKMHEAYFSKDFKSYTDAAWSHLRVVQKHMGRSLLVRMNADELGFSMEAPNQLGGPLSGIIEWALKIPADAVEPVASAALNYSYPKVRTFLARRTLDNRMRTAWTGTVDIPRWPTDA